MSEIESTNVEWEGPFTIRELIEPAAGARHLAQPGVYLWCDNEPKSLCYIGKSQSSLVARQREHYLHQLSMEYNLPEYARASGKSWACIWHLPEVLTVLLDREAIVAHVGEAFEYVHGVHIYLALLPADKVRRAERQLLWDLQPPGTKQGTRTPPSNPLPMTHSGADWRHAIVEARRNRLNWI